MKKRVIDGIEVEASSCNVFADLDLADAEKLKIKSGLVIEIAYSTQIEQPFHGKASRHSTRSRAAIPQRSERCGRGDAG
jgi:hypothetical protein